MNNPRGATIATSSCVSRGAFVGLVVNGLKASVERCNKAFAAVTEANMAERAGPTGGRSKIGALMYNTSHTNEHYGNIVTYMRLNNMVPPSSAPRGQ